MQPVLASRAKGDLKMKSLSRAMGLAAILATVGATTAASAQRLAVRAGEWTVDYGESRCTLARRLGGPQSPVVILSSYLGHDSPELMMLEDGSETLPVLPDRLDLVLIPSNEVRSGNVRTRRLVAGNVRQISNLGEGFIERFGEARSLRFQARGRVIATLDTPAAANAVKALKACNDDLLRSWGIDRAASGTWTRLPVHTGGTISHTDYPRSAVEKGQYGATVVRITVGVDGRVSNCVPVVRTGWPALDDATCEYMTERFRFDPALDAEGKPVAATIIRTVRWDMPL